MKLHYLDKRITLSLGALSGLAFAPIFYIPTLFSFAYLCYQIQRVPDKKQAFIIGFIFGFGHFLTNIYWVSIGVTVYIDEFWWALPFALCGLPIILACFIGASCVTSYLIKNNKYYQLIFCIFFVFYEWVRSWICTGFPWNLLGYALSFSDILIQPANVIGTYGLSFIVIYICTSPYYIFTKQYHQLIISLLTSIFVLFIIVSYGYYRLQNNPLNINNANLKIRLIQPSIPQIAKWDIEEFWNNLNSHIELSEIKGEADIIIWSEAALVVSYKEFTIHKLLLDMLSHKNAILITGSITDNNKSRNHNDFQIYSSMIALSHDRNALLFEYHKSHLVPFGEYMPLKNILPMKKLTPGLLDYSEGERKIVMIDKWNLLIKPLICYESIFPEFVRTSNMDVDVIINITNDAWYGQSSGPYQHFHISRMRAVENGIPLIRVANHGISAIIDNVGRIIQQTSLGEIAIIDGFLPDKLGCQTIYSKIGDFSVFIVIIFIFSMIYIISKSMQYATYILYKSKGN
jgi:apolipoprotein N-acyltransferase